MDVLIETESEHQKKLLDMKKYLRELIHANGGRVLMTREGTHLITMYVRPPDFNAQEIFEIEISFNSQHKP